MGRDKAVRQLRNLTGMISNPQLNVSLLLPMVDDFFSNMKEDLYQIIKSGSQAAKTLERLNEVQEKTEDK